MLAGRGGRDVVIGLAGVDIGVYLTSTCSDKGHAWEFGIKSGGRTVCVCACTV